MDEMEKVPMGALHQTIGKVARRVAMRREPVLVTFWGEPYVVIMPAAVVEEEEDSD